METENVYFYNKEKDKSSNKPFPDVFEDTWINWNNRDNVRLPNSRFNKKFQNFKIKNQIDFCNDENKIWSLINQELNKELYSINILIESIKKYSTFLINKNFDNLKFLVENIFTDEERIYFFDKLLPAMRTLALDLPNQIKQPIPILKQGSNLSLHFTQQQIGCLLANAFFCTFPERNESDYRLPNINFDTLFTKSEVRNHVKTEKLKCILNYFKRITTNPPTGVITFQKRCLKEKFCPDWQNSIKNLCNLKIFSDSIELHEGLQVSFANKFIGGGVLKTGCVQEEIRFLTNPELIVARLFTEKLLHNEVLYVFGSEQFNSYFGYAETFKWKHDFIDLKEMDQFQRKNTQIVSMDAINYSRETGKQYDDFYLNRDLNKAFIAFLNENLLNCETNNLNEYNHLNKPIVSGNWGCGAFKGDIYFKSTIQLLAASQAERELIYVSFQDDAFKLEFNLFYQFLIEKKFTVSKLYLLLKKYKQDALNEMNLNIKKSFFQYVYQSESS